LPSRLGTNRHKNDTGIVATKHKRKRKTGTETPMAEAMECNSRDIVVV
jgi:hypothetical protein